MGLQLLPLEPSANLDSPTQVTMQRRQPRAKDDRSPFSIEDFRTLMQAAQSAAAAGHTADVAALAARWARSPGPGCATQTSAHLGWQEGGLVSGWRLLSTAVRL